VRFSRRTLNIITICCFAIISWIHLGQVDPEQEPLEDLTLPELSDSGWRSWQSNEGVSSYWQQISSTGGMVRLLLQDGSFDFTLPQIGWATELQQQTGQFTSVSAVLAILIQGPWAEAEVQGISAYLIKHLALQTPQNSGATLGLCEQQFPAGSLWFRQHWAKPVADLNKALPLRAQWQAFRQQQVKQLRSNWLSHTGQLDIQTAFAYHRPPSDYYQTLYQALGVSQKTAAADYFACKQGMAAAQ